MIGKQRYTVQLPAHIQRQQEILAVAKAAYDLARYDDFSQPVTCPQCAPQDAQAYNAARLRLHEALSHLRVKPQTAPGSSEGGAC